MLPKKNPKPEYQQEFILIRDYMWFNHKIELVSEVKVAKSDYPKKFYLGPCNFDLKKAIDIDSDTISLECEEATGISDTQF